MQPIQLSTHFYLREFCFSQTAKRLGIDNRVAPHSTLHKNLISLCNNVLQPLRDGVGPVTVSSGYRSKELNAMVGGSPHSAHCHGHAADIVVAGLTPEQVCRWLIDSGLPYEQLIYEFGEWTHVSVARPGETPRRQVLTSHRGEDGKTHYTNGLHPADELP